MLLGEGSVFMIILLMGVYFILRSYRRERDLIKQQEYEKLKKLEYDNERKILEF